MQLFGAFRGATMFEAWFWRFYIQVPYWRFLRCGCRPAIGFDTTRYGG